MRASSRPAPRGRVKLARSFRRRATEAEVQLWVWLKNRGLGIKFRRQVPVGPYVVDFLSLETKLIVEVDGSQHGKESTRERDQERDGFLEREGYEVIRFWDRDVLKNLDSCLEYLGEKIDERTCEKS